MFKSIAQISFLSACFGLTASTLSAAQTSVAPDTIVVFDGSGSMWGQIQGRAKIEIARETLSTVLREIPEQSRVGMVAYGHREKGQCSDIETVVPVGRATNAVPNMISVANALKPKGKTPLSDAVRIAAEELRYTENAATVVLVTDGIETCNADPCALATELEEAGINFTAHVIGFGLSQQEGEQVQCLATNTGGLYLSADNAEELGDALRKTVEAQPIEINEDDFGPAELLTRTVRFILRDTQNGPQIGLRELDGQLVKEDGTPVEGAQFALAYPEANGNSATATLAPGSYVVQLRRRAGDKPAYDVAHGFTIPEGTGDYVVEASLSGSLAINVFINPDLPWKEGDPFPTAVGGSRPRFHFAVFPIVGGAKAAEPVARLSSVNLRDAIPLPPGPYLVQGNIDSGTSAERFVEVKGGAATELDFSFDATRVYLDARGADGAPMRKQNAYWYDKLRSGRNYWVWGTALRGGDLAPFYLPTGRWALYIGGSERIVDVPGNFQDLRLAIGPGEQLSDANKDFLNQRGNGCMEILKVTYPGCLIERADLSGGPAAGPSKAAVEPEPVPALKPKDASRKDAGATWRDFVFVDDTQTPRLHVILPPDTASKAEFILEQGWCGRAECGADRLEVARAELEILTEDGFQAQNINEATYKFGLSSFGQDKEIMVTSDQASRVRLALFDIVQVSQRDVDALRPAAQETSLSDNVNRIFGVFTLDQSGLPVGQIVADFLHQQQCLRQPLIIWPDGRVARKTFSEPKSANDNPFKISAEGFCQVSGSRFDCTLSDKQTGTTESWKFNSELLGDNHYSINEKGEARPTIAASCFYPGGKLKAAQVMPNGLALSDMLLRRDDGQTPGMGYDANNNVFRGN